VLVLLSLFIQFSVIVAVTDTNDGKFGSIFCVFIFIYSSVIQVSVNDRL
jgi:hypothetical protein